MTSSISRFYRLTMHERRERIGEVTGLEASALARLRPAGGLSEQHADRMVENALGVFGLPFGVCVNLRINERDVLAPMVVEEPSVVAACSYAAKLLRAGGGVRAECSTPIVVGQIQLLDVPDPDAAEAAVLGAEAELLALADSKHPRLCGAGGGARSLTIRHLPATGDDPCGDMFIVHVAVDVRDAMGANAVNSMCERLAPRIAELTGGRTALRILSNLSDERTVTVEGRIPYAALEGKGAASGEELAERIEEASAFAERDPYRACTHNKGIMNGVDAALIALGQDWRAVEAGAHAYAARDGRYTAMARWRAEDGHLVGRMTIPLAVGTVGGIANSHPVVPIARQIAKIRSAEDVAQLCAAVGLAQNLGALRALAAEGIQHGHMRLHARNIAVEAGAEEHEVLEVAQQIADASKVNTAYAAEVIAQMRQASAVTASDEASVTTVRMAPARNAVTRLIPRGKRPPTPRTPPLTIVTTPRPTARDERPMSGTVLVTGGGHLAALLVRRLLDDGLRVRALLPRGIETSRAESTLAGLAVELVRGDLDDEAATRAAVEGCAHVFHAPSSGSLDPASDAHRVRTLLRVARDAGVERVVVSGPAVGGALPEAHAALLVEREALGACVDGLDVVLLESATLVGPHDHGPSWIGQQLLDFANSSKQIHLPPTLSVLSAADAVQGHVLAMTRGRRGRRYHLRTCEMQSDELLDLFEEVSGRSRAPRLPARVLAPVVTLPGRFLGGIFRSSARSKTAEKAVPARHDDARRELGFEPTSVRRAVHAAYLDFARRDLVPSRAGTTAPPVTEIETRPRRRIAGT